MAISIFITNEEHLANSVQPTINQSKETTCYILYFREKPEEESSEWITILRREDGSVNFYRNWTDYKNGFGNSTNGDFFIGLEPLHNLTKSAPHELMIILKDWEGEMRYASYAHFRIKGEKEKYALNVLGDYTGDAGDALSIQKGMEFSTWDQDNDRHNVQNCAVLYNAGWWFNKCYYW